MKRTENRHYTEEELLMHELGEEAAETNQAVTNHLRGCDQCRAVGQEFRALAGRIAAWGVPELPPEAWQAQEAELLRLYREEIGKARGHGALAGFEWRLRRVWAFALENPLPTVGYVVLAVAFASERTITIFRMDRLIPGTADLLRILTHLLWG